MIDHEPYDLLDNHIDKEVEFSDDDSQDEIVEEDDYEEYRYN